MKSIHEEYESEWKWMYFWVRASMLLTGTNLTDTLFVELMELLSKWDWFHHRSYISIYSYWQKKEVHYLMKKTSTFLLLRRIRTILINLYVLSKKYLRMDWYSINFLFSRNIFYWCIWPFLTKNNSYFSLLYYRRFHYLVWHHLEAIT